MAEENEVYIDVNPSSIKDLFKKEHSKSKTEDTAKETRKIYLRAWGFLCESDESMWDHYLYQKLELWDKPHPKSYKDELELEILEMINQHAESIIIKDHYTPPSRPQIPLNPDGKTIDEKALKELIARRKNDQEKR